MWNNFLATTNITCGFTLYRCEWNLHISSAKLGSEECDKCVTLFGLVSAEDEQEAGRRWASHEMEAADFKRLSRQPTNRFLVLANPTQKFFVDRSIHDPSLLLFDIIPIPSETRQQLNQVATSHLQKYGQRLPVFRPYYWSMILHIS